MDYTAQLQQIIDLCTFMVSLLHFLSGLLVVTIFSVAFKVLK